MVRLRHRSLLDAIADRLRLDLRRLIAAGNRRNVRGGCGNGTGSGKHSRREVD
jgi:hypothetical protein